MAKTVTLDPGKQWVIQAGEIMMVVVFTDRGTQVTTPSDWNAGDIRDTFLETRACQSQQLTRTATGADDAWPQVTIDQDDAWLAWMCYVGDPPPDAVAAGYSWPESATVEA